MHRNSLFGVEGKVVLITGGAKGIGRMIAQGFVTNGAKVYITGRDAKACHATVSELNAPSPSDNNNNSSSSSSSSSSGGKRGSAIALPADLQHLTECQSLVSKLTDLEPAGLHVLINNAGAAWGEDIDTYPDSAWTKVLTLNLQRCFTLTQLCLPLLEKAAAAATAANKAGEPDPSRVVHIGSIDGIRAPTVANYAYSASKAGLHHLSAHLAKDLGPRGITSNVVACGPFRTKMMKATLDAFEEGLTSEIPLRRIGKPEDVAGACMFLASPAGSYCNGVVMTLDGGASLVAKI